MDERVAALRRHYDGPALLEADLAATWHEQLAVWWGEALAAGLVEPNAMVLSTVGPDGRPSSRHVLMKDFDADGVTFFTNTLSRKGRELAANPACSLAFGWLDQRRQVIVSGEARPVPEEVSDAYFATRPRGSQLGAWASAQSAVVADREALDEALTAVEARFGEGPVPRPPWWGGYLVVPTEVELWQGRRDRMHDRLRFTRGAEGWRVERLSP